MKCPDNGIALLAEIRGSASISVEECGKYFERFSHLKEKQDRRPFSVEYSPGIRGQRMHSAVCAEDLRQLAGTALIPYDYDPEPVRHRLYSASVYYTLKYLRAVKYYLDGKNEAAIKILSSFGRSYPNYLDSLRLLFQIYKVLKMRDEALHLLANPYFKSMYSEEELLRKRNIIMSM